MICSVAWYGCLHVGVLFKLPSGVAHGGGGRREGFAMGNMEIEISVLDMKQGAQRPSTSVPLHFR